VHEGIFEIHLELHNPDDLLAKARATHEVTILETRGTWGVPESPEKFMFVHIQKKTTQA
jgi:hypothetical protein